MRTESRELLAVGIFGGKSRLGDRIEILLRRGRTFSPRTSAAGVAASAIVLAALMLAGSLAPRWIAFAQQQPRPSFEVASVKLNTSGVEGDAHSFPPHSRGFTATNSSLKTLIQLAYKVNDSRLLDGPGWIDSARYDIAATPVEGNAGLDQSRLMLQTLLEDRFKLIARREVREMPVYGLVSPVGSLKRLGSGDANCVTFSSNSPPSLPAPGQTPRTPCGGLLRGPNVLAGEKISIAEFVETLGNILDRPVIDRTGFTGTFSFRLDFSAPGAEIVDGGNLDNRPSIFTALREQLGLKLESTKGPVEVLVIDHVEKPVAN